METKKVIEKRIRGLLLSLNTKENEIASLAEEMHDHWNAIIAKKHAIKILRKEINTIQETMNEAWEDYGKVKKPTKS